MSKLVMLAAGPLGRWKRRASPIHRLRIGLLACLAGLGCDGGSPEATPDSTAGGRLVEVSRFGTLEGPPELQFSSSAAGIVVDEHHDEVFVAEPQTREIRVFTRSGEFLRTFGRPGDGPGEFDESPVFTVARDTVLVLDRSRIHLFDRSGDLLATGRYSTVDGLPLPYTPSADSAGFVAWFIESDPYDADAGPFERMYRVDTDGLGLGEPLVEVDLDPETLGVLAEQTRVVHSGDGFVRTIGDRFELERLDLDGVPVDTLRFDTDPIPVPADAFSRFEAYLRAECEDAEVRDRCLRGAERRLETLRGRPIPDLRPVIGDLTGSRHGLVLVLRADLDPDPHSFGDETRYDLISTDGALVAELAMPPGFRPRWLTPTEIWGFELDNLDVPYVVGYELRR